MTRMRSRIAQYPGDVFLRLAIRRHIENGEVMQRMWPWPRCEDHDVKIVWCDIILKSRDVKIMYHDVNLRTLMASKLCDMELCTFLWCQSLSCGIILSTCDVRTIKQDVILRTFVTSTLCEWCHFEDSWCRKFVKLYHCYLWAVKTLTCINSRTRGVKAMRVDAIKSTPDVKIMSFDFILRTPDVKIMYKMLPVSAVIRLRPTTNFKL